MKRFQFLPFCVALICLLAACGDSSSTAQPTQSTIQPTSVPTIQLTAQSTHYPASSGPAVLGAEIGAFVAKYGQPNTAQGGNEFGSLDVTFDNNRAIAILDQGPDAGWTKDEAIAACLALAPPDNTYKRQMTLLDGTGAIKAIQRVYFSASLAPLLPANDFTDENGNTDIPGTFGIVLNVDPTNVSHYDSCSIQSVLQQK